MKYLITGLILSFSLFGEISVVTSKESRIDKVTKKELSNLYLKKSQRIGGERVEVYDSRDRDNYDEFYEKVVGKNRTQIHAYWMKQIFTGRKRPPRKLSDEELQKKINSGKRVLGYSSKNLDGKVIHETE
jgi:hypothetical protein